MMLPESAAQASAGPVAATAPHRPSQSGNPGRNKRMPPKMARKLPVLVSILRCRFAKLPSQNWRAGRARPA